MPADERLLETRFWTAELAFLPESDRPDDADIEGAREAIAEFRAERPEVTWVQEREDALRACLDSRSADRYAEAYGVGGVRRFGADDDTTVFQLKLETFPGHINNVYLLVKDDHVMLWDVGSGAPTCERDFRRSFQVLQSLFGADLDIGDLTEAIISHGHLDHYGGAAWIRKHSKARLLIHDLDRRVVELFDERFAVATRDVSRYFADVGVPDDELAEYMQMYTATKDVYRSVPIDESLTDKQRVGAGWQVIHVPGHCPGLICLKVGDVLLAADHVLARITPLQSPEAITPYTGLGHYFDSLAKVRRLDSEIRLTLPAHETPIEALADRVDEIHGHHLERLKKVRDLCSEPLTVFQVSQKLFGSRDGYARILAVLEAGAHVEYLFLRGALRVANAPELAGSDRAIEYLRH